MEIVLLKKKIKKKFGDRDKQRFFILINENDLPKFKQPENCECRGLVFGDRNGASRPSDFQLATKSRFKFINFLKIFFQTRSWIYWSDEVKCFYLSEIALPGYMAAKLADKNFILLTENQSKPGEWQEKIIKGMDEVILK